MNDGTLELVPPPAPTDPSAAPLPATTATAPVPADDGTSPSPPPPTPLPVMQVNDAVVLPVAEVDALRTAHSAVTAAESALGRAALEWERTRMALVNTLAVADRRWASTVTLIAAGHGIFIGEGSPQGCNVALDTGVLTRTR